MRDERDFAAYVVARGPALVCCLVLRGLTVPDAEAAAAEAFASMRDDWAELVYAGELNDALFGGVLDTDPETTTALLEEAATLPPLPLPYDRVRRRVADLPHRDHRLRLEPARRRPGQDRRRRAEGRRRPVGLPGRHRGPHPARAAGTDPPGGPQGLEPDDLPARRLRLAARDGRLVITRPVDRGAPRPYDARTGERLDTWYPGDWRVLDATFVEDDRVAWLAEREDGHAVLVVCGSRMDCAFPHDLEATGTPVIARDSLG